jgi:hypothetical protein
MGKPPRRPNLHQTASDGIKAQFSSASSSGSIFDLEFLSGTSSGNIWDHPMGDDSSDTLMSFLDTVEGWDSDITMPIISNLPLECNDWTLEDPPNVDLVFPPLQSNQQSPKLTSDLSIEAYQMQWGPTIHIGHDSAQPDNMSGHDCQRKAYDILESLSSLSFSNTAEESSPTTHASFAVPITRGVPLDLVLQLNREAAERLLPLVACPCIRTPPVALLYASIISRILSWYEQAADCIESNNLPSPNMAATSLFSFSDSTRSTKSRSIQAAEVIVAPSRMTIGQFKVDDPRLQTAMRIHLLAGETRRVKELINHIDSPTEISGPVNGEVEYLYRSLNTWLKRDYSRILDMMQTGLRKLDI